jgi:hypothetical protein
MKCAKQRRYNGVQYCTEINCEHDPLNRFVGCHKEVPWHKPTCSECIRLFPSACANDLSRRVDEKKDPSDEYLRLSRTKFKNEDMSSDARSDAISNKEESSDAGEDSSQEELRCNDSSDGYGTSCRNGARPPAENHLSLDVWMYGSGPQNKSNAMSTVPILYAFNATEFMSFNEIEFQIMGHVQEINPEAISRAIADIAGMVYRSKITIPLNAAAASHILGGLICSL